MTSGRRGQKRQPARRQGPDPAASRQSGPAPAASRQRDQTWRSPAQATSGRIHNLRRQALGGKISPGEGALPGSPSSPAPGDAASAGGPFFPRHLRQGTKTVNWELGCAAPTGHLGLGHVSLLGATSWSVGFWSNYN